MSAADEPRIDSKGRPLLSKQTLETALNSLSNDLEAAAAGGDMANINWPWAAETAAAGAELDAELDLVEESTKVDDELAAEHERLCNEREELDKSGGEAT